MNLRHIRHKGYRFVWTVPFLSLFCLISVGLYSQIPTTQQSFLTPSSDLTRVEYQRLIDTAFNEQCFEYGCPLYPSELKDIELTDRHDDFAMLTRWSNEHQFNQDRAVVIRPFRTKQTTHDEDFLVGVFDGHGILGHKVAEQVAVNLPKKLASFLSSKECCESEDWIKDQLNQTFVQVNEELVPSVALRGGCTATVTLRIGSKLFVANTGDSRTIIASYDSETKQSKQVYTTRCDKANLPDERARIEGLGGKIHIPKEHPNGSRVVVHSTAARPPEPIGLAMSRSIGDWEWKEVGVIADPIVDVLSVGDNNAKLFLVTASDGLWDLRKPDFYLNLLGPSLFMDEKTSLLRTLVNSFLKVAPEKAKWYRDDMTAIAMRIN